jgi:hypothetical protein
MAYDEATAERMRRLFRAVQRQWVDRGSPLPRQSREGPRAE